MKRFPLSLAGVGGGIVLCLWLLAGCATQPKIDWNTRIGSYTFDQAVIELGPPDKSARLEDGTTVADWLTARGRSGGVRVTGGLGHYHSYYPGSLWFIDDPPLPDRFLRLIFGPDGKLREWRRVLK